jgi:hypothetical protein
MTYEEHKVAILQGIEEENERLKGVFPDYETRSTFIIGSLVSELAMRKAREDCAPAPKPRHVGQAERHSDPHDYIGEP